MAGSPVEVRGSREGDDLGVVLSTTVQLASSMPNARIGMKNFRMDTIASPLFA
jgi:hypothetical protein